MSLLPRRARARETTAPAPPPAEQVARLQAQIDDPDCGSLRRRALRRQLAGIRAIGPSAPPTPPEPASVVLSADMDGYHAIVVAAINALDAHVREINQRLDGGRCGDFEHQELLAERRDLQRIRRQMVDDLRVPPLLTANQLRYLAFRTRESRENLWANAEREARSGSHRQARLFRMQALVAYRSAEQELGVQHQPVRFGG